MGSSMAAIDPVQFAVFRSVAPIFAATTGLLLVLSRMRSVRENPASGIFALYSLATIGFLVANLLEVSSRTPAGTLFWSRVIYLFIPLIPALWLSFAVKIARGGRPMGRGYFVLLLLVPAITFVLAFSDRWMPLMWPSIRYVSLDGYVITLRTHGPWFAVHAVYMYAVAGVGLIFALRAFVHQHAYYRRRSLLILMGISLPLAMSLVFILKPIPGLVKDFTPIAYAVAAFFFFFAIYRLDAFAIVPVARAQLVERMRDAILVFDAELRIADANSAALRLWGNGQGLLGKGVRSEGKDRAALPSAVVRAAETGVAGVFDVAAPDGSTRHYAVDAIDLPGHERSRGRLVVIRDETELRDALFRLEQLARKDPLTALANRRGFMEAAHTAFRSAERYDETIAAAVFDLDRFKQVNDSHGHAVGDAVLVAFARIVGDELRSSDVAGRIGGEEFALVLPKTTLDGALAVCERIRNNLAAHRFADDRGNAFTVTVSVGIADSAAAHRTLEDLLAAADMALYVAKSGGRNRIETAVRRQLPLDL